MDDGGLGLLKNNLFETSREEEDDNKNQIHGSQETQDQDELSKYLMRTTQSEATPKASRNMRHSEDIQSQRELTQEQVDRIKQRVKNGFREKSQNLN